MDALGVVFGVFLGTFFCFLAVVIGMPRQGAMAVRSPAPPGAPPHAVHGAPWIGEALAGSAFAAPVEELVILRVKCTPPAGRAGATGGTCGAFHEGSLRRGCPGIPHADPVSPLRGRYVDVMTH